MISGIAGTEGTRSSPEESSRTGCEGDTGATD